MGKIAKLTTGRLAAFAMIASVGALPLSAALGATADPIGSFRLPQGPNARPDVQGPEVPDAPAPRPAEVAPEPAAPANPASSVAASPAPSPTPKAAPKAAPGAKPTPRPAASPRPQPAAAARPAAPATPSTAETGAVAAPAADLPSPTDTTPSVDLAPLETIPAEEQAAAGNNFQSPWLIGVFVLLAMFAAALGGVLIWRRRAGAPAANALPIVRPRVNPTPQPAPQPALQPATPDSGQPSPGGTPPPAAPAPGEAAEDEAPLRVALEARRLSISLTAATLSYRLMLTNAGAESLRDIAVSGDMIAAHASVSQDEQLANQASLLVERHRIARLAPGESVELSGDIRLLLSMIRPIRKGDTALLVPLARLKVAAENGGGTLIQTAVIGQPSPRPGAGLLPFRLDMGPRIYQEVTQRIFS